MRIYPAVHYTMGGLWVDYNLMSTIPGLFVLGEANFSDHGANRLGASALMQGLADGYFIIPYTIGELPGDAEAGEGHDRSSGVRAALADVPKRASTRSCWRSRETARSTAFHRELGHAMWENCGMARNEAGSARRRSSASAQLREEFWSERQGSRASGASSTRTWSTPAAWPTSSNSASFVLGCAGTQRVVRRPFPRGISDARSEAQRDDAEFCYVAAWEYQGVGKSARAAQRAAHVRVTSTWRQRSYK